MSQKAEMPIVNSMANWTRKASASETAKRSPLATEGGAARTPAAPKMTSLGSMLKHTACRAGPAPVASAASWKSMGRMSSTATAPVRTLASISHVARMVNCRVITVCATTM
jgi:hypothetical protein